MKRALRKALAGVSAAGVAAAVAWASAAPVPVADGEGDGVIRLSWRMRGEAGGEECRRPTAEELADLPVHMRNPDACTGRGTAFRLTVALDGSEILSDTVEPAGARGDRPVFVLRDLRVEPGRHRLTVRFDPVPPGSPPAGPSEGDTEARRHVLDEVVEIRPRRILLITRDAAADRFVVREEVDP